MIQKNGVQEERVIVTPEIAEEWLGKNQNNRNLRKAVVEAYARDMREGRWRYVADPIRFDSEGILIDGQHRLSAVIQSGTTQTFLVVRGLPPETKQVIDTGANRRARDYLQMKGLSNSSHLASAARIYLMLFGRVFNSSQKITNSEIIDWVEKNPGLIDYIQVASKINREVGISLPASAAVLYRAYVLGYPQDALYEFGELLATGQLLVEGDPIFAIRRWFVRQKGRKGIQINVVLSAALLVKTINAHFRGQKINTLKWSREEGFPQLRPYKSDERS